MGFFHEENQHFTIVTIPCGDCIYIPQYIDNTSVNHQSVIPRSAKHDVGIRSPAAQRAAQCKMRIATGASALAMTWIMNNPRKLRGIIL